MVDALHRIHAALAPGGLLVDTQPISPSADVHADGEPLGALDQSEFVERSVAPIDVLVAQAPFALLEERRYAVVDRYDSGPTCLDDVSTWGQTRVPGELAERLRATAAPVRVTQDVRLRLLRAHLH